MVPRKTWKKTFFKGKQESIKVWGYDKTHVFELGVLTDKRASRQITSSFAQQWPVKTKTKRWYIWTDSSYKKFKCYYSKIHKAITTKLYKTYVPKLEPTSWKHKQKEQKHPDRALTNIWGPQACCVRRVQHPWPVRNWPVDCWDGSTCCQPNTHWSMIPKLGCFTKGCTAV